MLWLLRPNGVAVVVEVVEGAAVVEEAVGVTNVPVV